MSLLLLLVASLATAVERSNIAEQTCVLEKEAAQAVRRLWELPEEKAGSITLPVHGVKGAANKITWDPAKKTINVVGLFANMTSVKPLHLPRLEFRLNAAEFSGANSRLWQSVVRDLEGMKDLADPPEENPVGEDLAGRRRYRMAGKGEWVEFSLYKIKNRQGLKPADVGGDKRGLVMVVRCGPPRG